MVEGERRATRQRRAVEEALRNTDDFLSAQALHARLREGGDTIGLATVYRSLAGLVQDGRADMIRRHDGEAIYRLCSTTEHHHHLVCQDCGKTVEIEVPQDEEWAKEVARRHGFSDIWHTLEIFGTCEDCAKP
ncbi:Fur family transcriptional regulator [Austwickia chelonae]|uniref:Fur family transcriptional regulator n=1 Tax=Austwickia chelonae TaxID=100225 RepID=UPI000E220026|nr:transcriptional repressor [Austwickia chelonae]